MKISRKPGMKKDLTQAEIAYFAGIVDGEGSIMVTSATGKKGNKTYRLRMLVTNTNREVMDWIFARFGGSIQTCNQTAESVAKRHRVKFNWSRDADNAIEIIKVIYPFLIIKRKQAEIALRWPSSKRHLKVPKYREGLLQELQRINNYKNRFTSVQLQRLSVRGAGDSACNSPICNDGKIAERAEMTLRLFQDVPNISKVG